MKNLELKNNDKIKEILDTIKVIKSHGQLQNTTQGVTKWKDKRCGVCDKIPHLQKPKKKKFMIKI